jgi:hypothetical protein
MYAIKSLIANKKYDIAKKITDKMLSLYPTDISYLELLSLIYKATKNKHLNNLYKSILILDPNNILARSNLDK